MFLLKGSFFFHKIIDFQLFLSIFSLITFNFKVEFELEVLKDKRETLTQLLLDLIQKKKERADDLQVKYVYTFSIPSDQTHSNHNISSDSTHSNHSILYDQTPSNHSVFSNQTHSNLPYPLIKPTVVILYYLIKPIVIIQTHSNHSILYDQSHSNHSILSDQTHSNHSIFSNKTHSNLPYPLIKPIVIIHIV